MSKRTKFLLGIGVIAALVIGWQVAAFAVHDTGKFELDGNATNGAAAGDDWDNVCHQVLGNDCSTSNNTTGATAVDWVSEPTLTTSIFTGGGSKDPQDINNWAYKDGSVPDKDNLLHSFAARYTANGDEVLFFGSDRYDNSGDAQQGFWFFQNSIGLGTNSVGGGKGFTGVHKNGDLLIVSDFSVGGTTSTISVYEWNTACTKTGDTVTKPGTPPKTYTCGDANLLTLATSNAANCGSAAANDTFCGIVNPNTIQMPWSFTDKSGTTVPDGPDPGTAPDPNGALPGEFYEGGVNLTALGLGDRCFSSVASETRSSTSTTAVLKDFTLGTFGNCGSNVTTTPKDGAGNAIPDGGLSIGTGSVQVKDSANLTVSGTTTWTGSLKFFLCKVDAPATCTSGGTQVGPTAGTTVTDATTQPIVSGAATVTSAGRYCWRAEFISGTTGVPNGSDSSATECFTVNPVTPTLPTTAGDDKPLGTAVTDTATLGNTSKQPGTPVIQVSDPPTLGPNAGGTITFTLLKDDCSTTAPGTTPQTVNVNGNGDYTASVTPTEAGTYHWKATYTPASGDPNNLGSTFNNDCSDGNETVVVQSVPSSMTTAQSFIPNDSATVTASQGGALAGTVTFTAFESSDCTGNVIHTEDVDLTGNSGQTETVSTTNTTHSTTATNVSWRVSYTSTNQAQRSIPATCLEDTTLTYHQSGTATSQ